MENTCLICIKPQITFICTNCNIGYHFNCLVNSTSIDNFYHNRCHHCQGIWNNEILNLIEQRRRINRINERGFFSGFISGVCASLTFIGYIIK